MVVAGGSCGGGAEEVGGPTVIGRKYHENACAEDADMWHVCKHLRDVHRIYGNSGAGILDTVKCLCAALSPALIAGVMMDSWKKIQRDRPIGRAAIEIFIITYLMIF